MNLQRKSRLENGFRITVLLVAISLIFVQSNLAFGQPFQPKIKFTFSSTASSNLKTEVVVIQLYEEIDQGSASMMIRGIQEANALNAKAVIIDMNTPGGLVSDMVTIVDSINSSKIPVYTFVGTGSSAASAGSYIAMATDKIFMSNVDTVIGPSTPFVVGGTTSEQQHIQNYYAAYMVGLAEAHGRNVTAAEEMAANNTAFTGVQALQYHIADNYSANLNQTLGSIHASGASIITVSENPSEQVLTFLSANSTLDGVLLILGIIAIALDFFHPTILLTIGGVAMIILALIGEEAIQGPAGYLGIYLPITLYIIAATLIIAEIKTQHGFMLFAGVIIGAIGTILFAYQVPYVSPNPFSSIEIIELSLLIFAGGLLALYTRYIGSTLRSKPVTGQESLVGTTGIVHSQSLNPEGEISVNGVIWKSRLSNPSSGPIMRGDSVVIKSVDGLTLTVDRKL